MILMLVALGAGGFGGIYAGVIWNPQPELSRRLRAVQGVDLPGGGMGWGGGGYAITGSWLVGGFGYGGGRRIYGRNLTIRYAVGQGFFETGRVFHAGPVTLAVTLLLGGGGATVTLVPPLTDLTTDDLLRDPGRSATLQAGGVAGGVGGMVLIPVGGMILGIHAFGAYTAGDVWDLSEGNLLDAPAFHPYTAGLHLVVAMGPRDTR